LVFATRYRRGVFNDEILTRRDEVMPKVCEDFEAEPKEFNGGHDHVHLLVRYPPKVAVSKLVNSLKGVSARRYGWGYLPAKGWGRVHRPDQPRHHARAPVVALVFLRIVRRSTRWRSPASTSRSKMPAPKCGSEQP
jgi:REP element-mobilizing transposase RayT